MKRWTKVAVTGLLALVITGAAFAEDHDRDHRRDRDDSNYYGQRWEHRGDRVYRGDGDRDDRGVYNNGWYGNDPYYNNGWYGNDPYYNNGWYGNGRYDNQNGWYGNGRHHRRDRDDRDRDRDRDHDGDRR